MKLTIKLIWKAILTPITAIDETLDRKVKTVINYNPQAVAKILNLMDRLDLVDMWCFKPDLIRYICHTFFSVESTTQQ